MPSSPLPLDRPALHVDVSPGGEIILRGAYTSTHDGSTVDAATTSWPKESPGGASVDPGGLVDFSAGGFHVTSRDPVTHEVHAVAESGTPTACAALGVASPCLPLRLREPAQKRLITQGDWVKSLKGGIQVEVVAPPVYAPAVDASQKLAPWLAGAAALLAAAVGVSYMIKVRTRRAAEPRAQLLALARRVLAKSRSADPILAAPLTPALTGALARLEANSVDPASPEGTRVRAMLEKVDARLDDHAERERSQREQQVADELAREVEVAFEAAEEARAVMRR